MKTKIPSPSKSQGAHTPRRKSLRTLSVGSPALSTASGRLTSVVQDFVNKQMNSFALSPLPRRRSVLTDNTDIMEEPRRKSWWKNLNENSRNILEILDDNNLAGPEPNNIMEEFDVEILSQEKKNYTLDIPESSDGESIHSIVLPQRKLFNQKESQHQKKFGQIIGTRESMTKSNKNMTINDKVVNAGTKELFQNKPRSKLLFPPALLDISPDKTVADKTKEFATLPETQPRNIFGNRQGAKRKNMFADFIATESEDEIPEIQPKVFGFSKKPELMRRGSSASRGLRESSPTSNVTTDTEMDEWRMLPSSTMVEHQLEAMMEQNTPKRLRLSKLTEASGTSTVLSKTKSPKVNTSVLTRSRLRALNNSGTSTVGGKDKTHEKSEQNQSKKNNQHDQSQKNKSRDKLKEGNINSEQNEDQNLRITNLSQEKFNKSKRKQNKSLQKTNASLKVTDEIVNKSQEIVGNEEDKNESKEEVDGNQKVNIALEVNQSQDKTHKKEGQQNEVIVNLESKQKQKVIAESQEVEESEEFNESKKNYENKEEETEQENESQEVAEESDNEEVDKSQDQINESQEQDDDKEEQANESQTHFNESMEQEDKGQSADQSRAEVDESNDAINQSQVDKSDEENDEEIDQIADEVNESNEAADESNVIAEGSQEEEVDESMQAADESNEIADQSQEDKEEEQVDKSNQAADESNKAVNHTQDEVNKSNEVQNESQLAIEDDENEANEHDENSQKEDDEDETEAFEDEVQNESQLSVEDDENEAIEDGENTQEEVDESNGEENEAVDYENESAELHYESASEEMEVDDENDEDVTPQNDEDVTLIDQENITNTPEPADNEYNISHDTTGRNRNKHLSPEAILHDKTKQSDSFSTRRNTSIRKTKSVVNLLNDKPSLMLARDSVGFSDGTTNSSAEGSGWDSHRTTRKTIRQTFGRDATPRKSLRALVMEKSAKRRTLASETAKFPLANSTAVPEISLGYLDIQPVHQESTHEVSLRTRQLTLDAVLEKIKEDNLKKKAEIEESVKKSLETRSDDHIFKVPRRPMFPRRQTNNENKPGQVKPIWRGLPEEMIKDLQYRPPKRFKPSNAPWITKRLYKHLENKLEPKYDYKARVRAEKLVQTLYNFTKDLRRLSAATEDATNVLKHEMARLHIVTTHHEFYEFFRQFMPKEIRIKVIPDVVNKIPLPRCDVFSDIIVMDSAQG